MERKKAESDKIEKAIDEGNSKLAKLQKLIDELLSVNIPEEDLETVPFAEMTFKMDDSDEVFTVKDLVDDALRRHFGGLQALDETKWKS